MGRVTAYGKLPALGDFIRIGASPAFVAPWDAWLQTSLRRAREALGPRWDDCYLAAPIWRFTLAPGLAGPLPVAGVMMPSVDRVGRQFPLTLVGPAVAPDPVYWAALEDLALAALEDDMGRDRLAEELGELAPIAAAGAAPDSGSEWAAALADRTLEMTCPALPAGADALRLFDLAQWDDTQTREARA